MISENQTLGTQGSHSNPVLWAFLFLLCCPYVFCCEAKDSTHPHSGLSCWMFQRAEL